MANKKEYIKREIESCTQRDQDQRLLYLVSLWDHSWAKWIAITLKPFHVLLSTVPKMQPQPQPQIYCTQPSY